MEQSEMLAAFEYPLSPSLRQRWGQTPLTRCSAVAFCSPDSQLGVATPDSLQLHRKVPSVYNPV